MNTSTPLGLSPRVRSTPFTRRVEASGVSGYTVYNHMLLPTVFDSLEADYHHLKNAVQVWDVACERQIEVKGPDRQVNSVDVRLDRRCEMRIGFCMYENRRHG